MVELAPALACPVILGRDWLGFNDLLWEASLRGTLPLTALGEDVVADQDLEAN